MHEGNAQRILETQQLKNFKPSRKKTQHGRRCHRNTNRRRCHRKTTKAWKRCKNELPRSTFNKSRISTTAKFASYNVQRLHCKEVNLPFGNCVTLKILLRKLLCYFLCY